MWKIKTEYVCRGARLWGCEPPRRQRSSRTQNLGCFVFWNIQTFIKTFYLKTKRRRNNGICETISERTKRFVRHLEGARWRTTFWQYCFRGNKTLFLKYLINDLVANAHAICYIRFEIICHCKIRFEFWNNLPLSQPVFVQNTNKQIIRATVGGHGWSGILFLGYGSVRLAGVLRSRKKKVAARCATTSNFAITPGTNICFSNFKWFKSYKMLCICREWKQLVRKLSEECTRISFAAYGAFARHVLSLTIGSHFSGRVCFAVISIWKHQNMMFGKDGRNETPFDMLVEQKRCGQKFQIMKWQQGNWEEWMDGWTTTIIHAHGRWITQLLCLDKNQQLASQQQSCYHSNSFNADSTNVLCPTLD